jgi:hypothetical protein
MSDVVEMLQRMSIAMDADGIEAGAGVIRQWSKARAQQSKPWPVMPARRFGPHKRTSLTALRNRHLDMVEEMGCRPEYDRSQLGTWFLENWDSLFGTLRRSKAAAVPSDIFRKEFVISKLLNLIELRRVEIEHNVRPGCLPAKQLEAGRRM